MIDKDILPCPFCGSIVDTDECPYLYNREGTLWKIKCVGMDCGGYVVGKSEEDAITQWNHRVHLLHLRWTTVKPTSEGNYWLRGWSLDDPKAEALVQVRWRKKDSKLVCNLHCNNSERDLSEWFTINFFNPNMEWKQILP